MSVTVCAALMGNFTHLPSGKLTSRSGNLTAVDDGIIVLFAIAICKEAYDPIKLNITSYILTVYFCHPSLVRKKKTSNMHNFPLLDLEKKSKFQVYNI